MFPRSEFYLINFVVLASERYKARGLFLSRPKTLCRYLAASPPQLAQNDLNVERLCGAGDLGRRLQAPSVCCNLFYRIVPCVTIHSPTCPEVMPSGLFISRLVDTQAAASICCLSVAATRSNSSNRACRAGPTTAGRARRDGTDPAQGVPDHLRRAPPPAACFWLRSAQD